MSLSIVFIFCVLSDGKKLFLFEPFLPYICPPDHPDFVGILDFPLLEERDASLAEAYFCNSFESARLCLCSFSFSVADCNVSGVGVNFCNSCQPQNGSYAFYNGSTALVYLLINGLSLWVDDLFLSACNYLKLLMFEFSLLMCLMAEFV